MPLHGLWGAVDSTTQQFARAPAHKLAQMKDSDLPVQPRGRRAAAARASSGADGAAGGRSMFNKAGKTGKRLASQAAKDVTKAELEALYYLPLSAAAKHIGVRALATRTQLCKQGACARACPRQCRRKRFRPPARRSSVRARGAASVPGGRYARRPSSPCRGLSCINR